MELKLHGSLGLSIFANAHNYFINIKTYRLMELKDAIKQTITKLQNIDAETRKQLLVHDDKQQIHAYMQVEVEFGNKQSAFVLLPFIIPEKE